MGWRKKARYSLLGVGGSAAWLRAEGMWEVGAPFWGYLAVVCFLSAFLLWISELTDKEKTAPVKRVAIPDTWTWLTKPEIDDIIEQSTILQDTRAKLEADRRKEIFEHRHRKLTGQHDRAALRLQKIWDTKLYLFEKILEDYPEAQKGDLYSKDIFKWVLRRMAMEKDDK